MTSPPLPTAASPLTSKKVAAVLNTNATATVLTSSQLPSPPPPPINPSTSISINIKPDIHIAPVSLATDSSFITSLTNLINQIYTDSERGFWNIDPFTRTTPSEVREFITTGTLAIAWLPGSSRLSIGELMGCGRVQLLSPTPTPDPWGIEQRNPDAETETETVAVGQFGCLICHPRYRGCGVGRDLLKFAETWAKERGAGKMQVELVVGDGWEHEEKVKLARWYERAGYKTTKEVDLWEGIPELGPLLRRGARYRVYQKGL
ncbi:hypothetical protein B0T20DRAFT_137969 [Sordaria brevicollis]|uniref:N-acetyltransferase domain-containing protein n=1 Tax=Sordaria brevicollis TaxID=83679 RepID=A0AAE0PLZ2_SORBR|nr:hypothetical protein B0T20DRAFT_137969 [Sordaria brevicollis]